MAVAAVPVAAVVVLPAVVAVEEPVVVAAVPAVPRVARRPLSYVLPGFQKS